MVQLCGRMTGGSRESVEDIMDTNYRNVNVLAVLDERRVSVTVF